MNWIVVTNKNCLAELWMAEIVRLKLKYRAKIDSFGKYYRCSAQTGLDFAKLL